MPYIWKQQLLSRFGFVELGDLTLYDNGNCRAGDRVFDRGVPIDGHAFGGACVLRRRIDEPDEIEVLDGAGRLRFRYSLSDSAWYRQTSFESPLYDWLADRFGVRPAYVLYRAIRMFEKLWSFVP